MTGDEREEQVRCFGFEGDGADLVHDGQRDPAQPGQPVAEPAGLVGSCEGGDPLDDGAERNRMSWGHTQGAVGASFGVPPETSSASAQEHDANK